MRSALLRRYFSEVTRLFAVIWQVNLGLFISYLFFLFVNVNLISNFCIYYGGYLGIRQLLFLINSNKLSCSFDLCALWCKLTIDCFQELHLLTPAVPGVEIGSFFFGQWGFNACNHILILSSVSIMAAISGYGNCYFR